MDVSETLISLPGSVVSTIEAFHPPRGYGHRGLKGSTRYSSRIGFEAGSAESLGTQNQALY